MHNTNLPICIIRTPSTLLQSGRGVVYKNLRKTNVPFGQSVKSPNQSVGMKHLLKLNICHCPWNTTHEL